MVNFEDRHPFRVGVLPQNGVDASGEQTLAGAKRYEGFRVQKSRDAVKLKHKPTMVLKHRRFVAFRLVRRLVERDDRTAWIRAKRSKRRDRGCRRRPVRCSPY